MSQPDSIPDPVADLWRSARNEWGGIEVGLDAFRAHVDRHLPGPDAVERLFGADLYLACACAAGDRAALRAFEERVLPAVDPALRRLDPSPAFVDEVRQLIRAKLFVGEPGARPKIADYAGRGPLATWVRVAAVRTALNVRGAARERPAPDTSLADVAALDDPALRLLKQRFAAEFKVALARASERLTVRDRTILRLRFVDGLNIDQIGAIYGAHRATVARWVARIRDTIFAGTRDALRVALRLRSGEFESLLAVAHSQLDVSLGALLGPLDPPA